MCVCVCMCRYLFVKLGLNDMTNSYEYLRIVHNWLPLILFVSVLLSRVCTAQRNFILTVSLVRTIYTDRVAGIVGT